MLYQYTHIYAHQSIMSSTKYVYIFVNKTFTSIMLGSLYVNTWIQMCTKVLSFCCIIILYELLLVNRAQFKADFIIRLISMQTNMGREVFV